MSGRPMRFAAMIPSIRPQDSTSVLVNKNTRLILPLTLDVLFHARYFIPYHYTGPKKSEYTLFDNTATIDQFAYATLCTKFSPAKH